MIRIPFCSSPLFVLAQAAGIWVTFMLGGVTPTQADGANAKFGADAPLDFAQVRVDQRAALAQALTSPPSETRDALILANADLIAFSANDQEQADLENALEQKTSSTDAADLFRAWKHLQLILSSVNQKAAGISVPMKEILSGQANSTIVNEFAEDRDNLGRLKKDVDGLAPNLHRSVLQASIAIELAMVARIGNDNDAAIAAIDPVLPQIQWAAQTAPLILSLTQLRSAAARDRDGSDDTARAELERLTSAAGNARAFWSYHPLLTDLDEEAAIIASEAGLHSAGRLLLDTLLTKDRAARGTVDEQGTISRIAFGLDDVQVGARYTLDVLSSAASRFDTSGNNWQQVVATLYANTMGDLPKEIGLLSALLADQRIAPAKSATRHWAVLQLAKLYEYAGDNISARALRKATLPLKLPPDIAEFFGKTHTAAELEKAGTDFGADPTYADPARRVYFLTKAFKQRVAGEGFPNSDSFLSLGLLVDALAVEPQEVVLGETESADRRL
jgi:hypothetical protein